MDGHGTIVTFGTSGFSANLIDVDGPGMTREAIDDTYMDTATAMAFCAAALYDGGEVTLTVKHLTTALPPISAVAETITIDWAGLGAGNKFSFTGFATGYSPGAAIGARMEGKLTVKVTGAVTAV